MITVNIRFLPLMGLCISMLLVNLNIVHACDADDLPESYLNFIENKGQWHDNITYQAELPMARLYLESDRLTYLLMDPADIETVHEQHHSSTPDMDLMKVDCHAFYVHFAGANPDASTIGNCLANHHHNYYQSNDPSKWASQVPLYNLVNYYNLYDGIDMSLYGEAGSIKYDFIVAAGADVNQIQLQFEGNDAVFIEEGNLHITTSVNTLIEQAPYAYQYIDGQLSAVACNFQLDGNTLSFHFPDGYDATNELIIDPLVVFSTYSGSTTDNWGFTATYDDDGHLYAGGTAFGVGYPTTPGAFQVDFAGGDPAGPFFVDISITKYTVDGSALEYSTYLGGATSSEMPHSLWVNSNNELYVYGSTGSDDFPVTPDAYDSSFNGGTPGTSINNIPFTNGSDIIVSRFNADGSNLLGSTYIGGIGNDGLNQSNTLKYNYADEARGEVFLDNDGNVFIGTTTQSPDFPTTPDAYQQFYGGGLQDGAVVKLDPALSGIIWATYIGGSGDDATYALKLGADDNLYFGGGTTSNNFPTSADAVNPAYLGGLSDAYVGKLNIDGTDLLAATYLGTSFYDQAFFVDLDPDGNVYAFGQTAGTYPVSGGVYNNPNSGMFLHKLNSTLSATEFSTVLGNGNGSPNLAPTAFLVDNCYQIYISGWGGNLNGTTDGSTTEGLPVSADAFQTTTDGSDMYFMILEQNASDLHYATFFGAPSGTGEHVDGGTSRFDKKGIIYQAVCAGCGSSDLFPTTPGAWSNTNNSANCNLGAIKFGFEIAPVIASFEAPDIACAPLTIDIVNTSSVPGDGMVTYEWDFGNTITSTSETPPTLVYDEPGVYEITLIVTQLGTCNDADTTVHLLTIEDLSVNAEVLCEADSPVLLEASIAGGFWDGAGISNPAVGEFDPSGLAPGEYEVIYVVASATCETEVATMVTVLGEPLIEMVTPPYCLNDGTNAFAVDFVVTGDDTQYTIGGDFSTTVNDNEIFTLSSAGDGSSYVVNAMGINTDCVAADLAFDSPFCLDCFPDAGTVPSELEIVCDSTSVTVNTVGEVLEYNPNTDVTQVLGYVVHTEAGTTPGFILGQNSTGTFTYADLTSAAHNTVYYISPIVGYPDANGFPILDDECTVIAAGTPVVFLAPLTLTINEWCDWMTGEYHIVGFIQGGYPAWDNSTTYTVTGEIFEMVLASADTAFNVIIPEGQASSYEFIIDDPYCGTSVTEFDVFECSKTPIELVSFTGKALENGNLLDWTTATEQNNDYFTVEATNDLSKDFVAIGVIQGSGNSYNNLSYSFLHTNALNGITYYRLRNTDYNGQQQVSEVISVDRATTSNVFVQVSPTPAQTMVHIHFNHHNNPNAQLTIFDIRGALVYSSTLEANSQQVLLDISTWNDGMYLVQLSTNHQTLVQKLLKN